MHRRYVVLGIAIVSCLAYGKPSGGLENFNSGPYCGVYSLYAVMGALGVETELADLLQPQYIGSPKGSSLAELVSASRDAGLYAEAAVSMNCGTLARSPYPLILHVKRDAMATQYDHYVAFFGVSDGNAIILDPPKQPELMSFGELRRRWSGNGVVVSAEPIRMASLRGGELLGLAVVVVVVLGLLFLIRRASEFLQNRVGRLGGRLKAGVALAQVAGVLVSASTFGLFFHLSSDVGLLASPDVLKQAAVRNFGHLLPKVDAEAVREAMRRNALIVDARFESDFSAGHIEGALNVPPFSSPEEVAELLDGTPADREIIVYCQSGGCPYAERIARVLDQIGYANLRHFRGGWVRWENVG